MLNPTIKNEYVLEAWAASHAVGSTRLGVIRGPNGPAAYIFVQEGGVWNLIDTQRMG